MNNDSGKWDMWDEVMNKACLVCGRPNRFHRVFWDPIVGYHVRQTLLDGPDTNLVPFYDHYAIVDNLRYLEWLDEQRNQQ